MNPEIITEANKPEDIKYDVDIDPNELVSFWLGEHHYGYIRDTAQLSTGEKLILIAASGGRVPYRTMRNTLGLKRFPGTVKSTKAYKFLKADFERQRDELYKLYSDNYNNPDIATRTLHCDNYTNHHHGGACLPWFALYKITNSPVIALLFWKTMWGMFSGYNSYVLEHIVNYTKNTAPEMYHYCPDAIKAKIIESKMASI